MSTFGLKRSQTESEQVHFHQKWKGTFPPSLGNGIRYLASTAPKHSPQTNVMYNQSGYRFGLPNHNQKKKKPIEAHSSSSILLKSEIS